MNDQVLATLIAETVDRAARRTPVPLLRPATVTAFNPDFTVDVLIDGDTNSITATTLVGPVPPAARVMVLFYPPSGATVIGTIGGTSFVGFIGRATTQNISDATTTLLTFDAIDYDPFGWFDPADPQHITPTFAGVMTATAYVGYQSATDYTRRLADVSHTGVIVARMDLGSGATLTNTPQGLWSATVAAPSRVSALGDWFAVPCFQDNNANATRTVGGWFSVKYEGAPLR